MDDGVGGGFCGDGGGVGCVFVLVVLFFEVHIVIVLFD